jgi:cytochrome c553
MGCADTGRGDPARGEQIHAVCLPCHGTSLYSSPQRKIRSLPALRQEVARWGDYYNPALSEQDIDDVTAYLNTQFYKF